MNRQFTGPKAVFNPFLSFMQNQIWLKVPMPHPEQAPAENGSLRRNAARVTIIEAARSVVARIGTIELSLSAVAAEAGLNASTVFGHFRNKDELLIAVLAEDLANIASIMRGEWAPADLDGLGTPEASPTAASQAAIPENEAPAPITAATDSNVVRLYAGDYEPPADDISPTVAATPSMPHQPSANAEIGSNVNEVAELIESIDCRLKQLETGATSSATLSEHGMKALFDRMEAFERQQKESLDALSVQTNEMAHRQRESTAEMRAVLNDTATRMEVLESQRLADQERPFGRRNSDLPDRIAGSISSPAPQLEETDEAHDADSYRSAAERAASAAATLATIDAPIGKKNITPAQKFQSLKRQHILIATFVVGIVFVIAAFAAFYVGHARGRGLAMASLAHSVVQSGINSASSGRGSSRPSARQQSALQNGNPRQAPALLAQRGSPAAELVFGLQLLRGEGATPNKVEAAQWIRRAAEKRNAVAQYWLGALYEHGDGVAPDAAEAVRWYEAAAIQGNRKAMHALGIAYAQGLGTQRNYSEAARWFAGAAELGLVNSQFNLGVLYERGLGVPPNLLNAYKWYAVAAGQGDEESRARVTALKTQLSADDLAASERAMQGFHAQAPRADANDTPVAARLH